MYYNRDLLYYNYTITQNLLVLTGNNVKKYRLILKRQKKKRFNKHFLNSLQTHRK